MVAQAPVAPAGWRKYAAPAACFALFFLLACAMFAPVLFGHHWFLWDVPDEYWPDLSYLCRSLHEGHWPLWNPYDRGGYPFHADPQSGMYYPLNWGLCAVGGASPALAVAQWRVALHFVLAGCAMTAFCRALGLSWGASFVGGVAFMLAPYQRRMWAVNLTYTIAYLPLVLWALERLAQKPCVRRAAVLALVVALAVSVGSPPSLYFTALVSCAYALVRLGPVRKSYPYLALAGALVAGLCAVMVLPTAQLAHFSVQHGRDYASISEGGYGARELWGLFYPRNKYLYLGPAVLALATLALLSRKSPAPRGVRALFALLAVGSALMTLGDHSLLYRVAYRVLPGVSAFRGPVRYSAVLGCATAVLAAMGAAALPRARWSAWVAAACVVGAAWVALPADREARPGPPPGSEARWRALASNMEDVRSQWRYWDEFGVGLRSGTRFLARDFRGYQDPLELARYEHVVDDLYDHPRLLEQFNVRYLLRGPHFVHGTGHHFLPAGSEPAFADARGDGLWETRTPLPEAYWVPSAAVLADERAVFERLRAQAPAFLCLLEAGDGPVAASADARATDAAARPIVASDVRIERERVSFDVDAPRAGWVVVNEAYYPGWRATVSGAEVALRRANYLVRALPVPAGRQHVVLEYAPRGYRGLALLALASLAAALALCALRPRSP